LRDCLRAWRGQARQRASLPVRDGSLRSRTAPSVMLRCRAEGRACHARVRGQECERVQNDRLRNAKVGRRLAREEVARQGWTGMRGSFAVDREAASREQKADVRSSGSDFDAVLEGARGDVHGKPARAMAWSEREARFVWWSYDQARRKWWPEGVEAIGARKLRVELSDANEGRSVEEVLAKRVEGGRSS
jgi:hypothetical protein